MIYKWLSVHNIIAKVFTDLDLQEESHRVYDMIEWAGEAIKKIGAFGSFKKNVTGSNAKPDLVVEDYQAKLPDNVFRVIQAFFSDSSDGTFYPMRYATGSLDGVWYNTVRPLGGNDVTAEGVSYIESDLVQLAMLLYDLTYEEALQQLNDGTIDRDLLISILGGNEPSDIIKVDDRSFDLLYVVENGVIRVNQKTGYIRIAYEEIPTDEDGYPLIPDNESYREAIYWYIVMKLLYPKWVIGKVRDAVYYEARNSWNYYLKQAYGNAIMPNRDMMESIKNNWNRLVPEMTEHDTGFQTLGQRQIYWNNNYDY